MPISMAGSRGGTIGHSSGTNGVEFAARLLTGRVSFSEFCTQLSGHPCPRSVTLVVNNTCNLKCAHCYLQVEKLTAPALSEGEWQRLIDSIAEVNPELICLSGKEVFVGEQGGRLLSYLREARDRTDASSRVGVISNGTLISRHRETILGARPSYFDISLDGIESDHDAVRGEGAFAKAWPNVVWAAETFGQNFFVNLTVQKQNFERLTDAVRFLSGHGVQNVVLGFYMPLPYTDPGLALTQTEFDSVFERLAEMEDLALDRPLRILFDFDILILEPFKAFLRSNWFSLNEIQEDANGELFVEHRLKNGVVLEMRFAPWPAGISKSARITPEGNYLAAEDTVDTTQYAARSLGNVRDFDFDFEKLHAHARGSVRFRELLRDFYSRVLPELVSLVSSRADSAVAA